MLVSHLISNETEQPEQESTSIQLNVDLALGARKGCDLGHSITFLFHTVRKNSLPCGTLDALWFPFLSYTAVYMYVM